MALGASRRRLNHLTSQSGDDSEMPLGASRRRLRRSTSQRGNDSPASLNARERSQFTPRLYGHGDFTVTAILRSRRLRPRDPADGGLQPVTSFEKSSAGSRLATCRRASAGGVGPGRPAQPFLVAVSDGTVILTRQSQTQDSDSRTRLL
jgi:hypothetical protein